MTNPLLVLAEYTANWRTRRLSDELDRHSRRALIDYFASLLPGSARAPARLLANGLQSERCEGRAVCYADGRTANLRYAALLNAVASHTVEFDDIYRDAGYHPGAPTISAALAAAQARATSLDHLSRAIVAGYEISCRIGIAVQPTHYKFWHTTATVGTFGAAAAVSVLLELDAAQTAHALAAAATMAGGLQQAFRGDGMSKPMHAGHAADAGCLAALAAASGVTGALDVLHGPVGFAAATSESTGKWALALEGLEQPPAIATITFKNHGCCGHIFAALDAVVDLKRERGFDADDVLSIQVAGYGQTKEICDRPVVRTEQEARFSLQYCMAALLLLGGVRLAAFADERIVDPAIQVQMRKVSVEIDPELADAYPTRRAARVTVNLRDGIVLRRYQQTRVGDPESPMSDAALSEKFMELSGPVIGPAAAAALLSHLWERDDLPGIVPLLISGPSTSHLDGHDRSGIFI